MTIPAFRSLLNHHDVVKSLPSNNTPAGATIHVACVQFFHKQLPKLTLVGATSRDWFGCVTKQRTLFNQFTGLKEIALNDVFFRDKQQCIDVIASFPAAEKISVTQLSAWGGEQQELFQSQRPVTFDRHQISSKIRVFQACFGPTALPENFLPLMQMLGPQIEEWTFELGAPREWNLKPIGWVMDKLATAKKAQKWRFVIHDRVLDRDGLASVIAKWFAKHLRWRNNRIKSVVLEGACWSLTGHIFKPLIKESFARTHLPLLHSLVLPEYNIHSYVPIRKRLSYLDTLFQHPQFQKLKVVYLTVSSTFKDEELQDAGYDAVLRTVRVGSKPWTVMQEKVKVLVGYMPWTKKRGILRIRVVYLVK